MTGNTLLDDYIPQEELAREFKCSKRTIARYENQKDGLPSVMIAGRKYHRRESVKTWLEKCETQPNPTRAAAIR